MGATVTVTVVLPVQPLASVPVILYVEVTVGLAVTTAPIVADSPVEGLHIYVIAPDACKGVLAPGQRGSGGTTVITGNGFTVTVTISAFEQPLDVPVTVYAVVMVGFAITIAPVVTDKPVAGLHT